MAAKAKSTAKTNGNGQDHLLDDETMADLSVLSLDPGGEVPAKSELVLKGASKAIGNELKKNQEVLLMVHAQVVDVHFPADKRRHILEIVDMYEETSEEAAEALADKDVSAIATPSETEDVEEVDGEVVDEPAAEADPEDAAMEEAAGDLEW